MINKLREEWTEDMMEGVKHSMESIRKFMLSRKKAAGLVGKKTMREKKEKPAASLKLALLESMK